MTNNNINNKIFAVCCLHINGWGVGLDHWVCSGPNNNDNNDNFNTSNDNDNTDNDKINHDTNTNNYNMIKYMI